MSRGRRALAGGVRALALGAALLVIAVVCWPPLYAFPPAAPFSGEHWYNPYQPAGAGVWLRVNLHAHSRLWGGLQPRALPAERLRRVYRELGYDLAALSNYMSIVPREPGEDLYVPVYEHGYGLRKWHYTVVGAEGVDYLDFPLFQPTAAKQYLVDRLRPDAGLLIINHPNLLDAFSLDEMREVTGYDGIELRSRFASGETHWDAALSAGRLVFGYASDDHHAGIGWLLVHARERSSDALLDALRRGCFVSVVAKNQLEPNGLVSQRIERGHLCVRLRERADVIRVVGQDGALRRTFRRTDAVDYPLDGALGYLRVHAVTRGTHLFVQPVVRTAPGGDPSRGPRASRRPVATALRRTGGVALALAAGWALFPSRSPASRTPG